MEGRVEWRCLEICVLTGWELRLRSWRLRNLRWLTETKVSGLVSSITRFFLAFCAGFALSRLTEPSKAFPAFPAAEPKSLEPGGSPSSCWEQESSVSLTASADKRQRVPPPSAPVFTAGGGAAGEGSGSSFSRDIATLRSAPGNCAGAVLFPSRTLVLPVRSPGTLRACAMWWEEASSKHSPNPSPRGWRLVSSPAGCLLDSVAQCGGPAGQLGDSRADGSLRSHSHAAGAPQAAEGTPSGAEVETLVGLCQPGADCVM